jgi:PAS domain S-box-containing protein
MQVFDFSSPRFIDSFPNCSDGIVFQKYYQLLQQLFPDHCMFFLLLNNDGELFVDLFESSFTLMKPDALIYQFANGSEILLTDNLSKKPFKGIFCSAAEENVKFFICCRIRSLDGRLIGGFGVMSEQPKSVLPDEKIFIQWLAENIATDIVGAEQVNSTQLNEGTWNLQQEILLHLDDIYLIVETNGNVLSYAKQLPKLLEQALFEQGSRLSVLFGEKNSHSLTELVRLCELSNKKQTEVLNIKHQGGQYLFSVSCNLFDESSFILTFHDVTERYRLREVIDERRNILESIINVGNVGVLVLDEQGGINYCNTRVLQWFNIKDTMKNVKIPFEYWTHNSFGESPFKKIFESKEDLKDVRYSCFIASGEMKTFSINGVVNYFTETDKITGTFFLQDVTERALLEQAMKEMEQQMQFLLNSSPVIIYQMISIPFHQYTYISPNCVDILGCNQHDILNEGTFWQEHVHPDDKAQLSKVGDVHSVQVVEYRFWIEERQAYRWLKDIRRMTNEENCWIGALHDVTELKEAEQNRLILQEEISATLASLADAVITLDRHGVIQGVNPATCRMFGYQKEQLTGLPISTLLLTDMKDHLQKAMSHPYNQTEAVAHSNSHEVKALHANGHEFPVALSMAMIGENEKIRFVGCCHDLSEIKKQQEQLLHSEKLGAVGKLTSSIAHDFNNILGIVRGYAEMLQHEGDHIAKLSLPIIEASDRASSMISQLLDFSSSKTREVTLINLNQHLVGLRSLLEKSISSGIRLFLECPEQAIGVKVELSAFDNLLINMAVNANHAMQGKGNLSISIRQITADQVPPQLDLPDGQYAHIAIADDGCGMSEQVRKKIFEPFFTTKGDKGTGLGLAQAYGMIQRCAGAIAVDSVVGQGSCFHIYLPATAPSSAPIKPISANIQPTRMSMTAPLGGTVKTAKQEQKSPAILLVDDEQELLEMHALLLESAGYRVYKAYSGAEALEVIQQQPIELLLSDIMMPKMNGLELARRIKADYPLVKVQLISGFADSSMVSDEESKAWFEQRLAKPVPMTTLLQRVSLLVSNR